MPPPTVPDETIETPAPAETESVILAPNFDRPLTPIADLVASPDFPQCALGEFVNIGGYTGVVQSRAHCG